MSEPSAMSGNMEAAGVGGVRLVLHEELRIRPDLQL